MSLSFISFPIPTLSKPLNPDFFYLSPLFKPFLYLSPLFIPFPCQGPALPAEPSLG